MRWTPYVDDHSDLLDADFLETYGIDYFSLADQDYARCALLVCNLPSSSRFKKTVDPITDFYENAYLPTVIERNLRYVIWSIQFQHADKNSSRQRSESEPRELLLPPEIQEIMDAYEREKNKETHEEMSIDELKAILEAPRTKSTEKPSVL